MTNELLACPFCGGRALYGFHDRPNSEHIYCVDCGVEVAGNGEEWNTRVTRPAASVDVEYTDKEVIEFLQVAFRHVKIVGELELNDVRVGMKFIKMHRQAIANAEGK